jgi:hypothetical protein
MPASTPLAGDTGPPSRRVFVFLVVVLRIRPESQGLRERLLFADSRQRGRARERETKRRKDAGIFLAEPLVLGTVRSAWAFSTIRNRSLRRAAPPDHKKGGLP